MCVCVRLLVCVCVCVCARARSRACLCVCMYVCWETAESASDRFAQLLTVIWSYSLYGLLNKPAGASTGPVTVVQTGQIVRECVCFMRVCIYVSVRGGYLLQRFDLRILRSLDLTRWLQQQGTPA